MNEVRIYNVAKLWVKNREAILTQNVATFISKNRLRFLDQMFTKAQTSKLIHKKTHKRHWKAHKKQIKHNQAQSSIKKHNQAQSSIIKHNQA